MIKLLAMVLLAIIGSLTFAGCAEGEGPTSYPADCYPAAGETGYQKCASHSEGRRGGHRDPEAYCGGPEAYFGPEGYAPTGVHSFQHEFPGLCEAAVCLRVR